MKLRVVPDADDFQATYGPEDTENGRGKVLDLDAPRRKNTRVMATLTDRAVRWLERQPKSEPFFLYFAPVAVHNPVTPDKDMAGKSAAGPYGDWIQELDRSVGVILSALDRLGVAENTLVLFTSDNGGVREPQKTDSPQTRALNAGLAINGPLRGGKHHIWEGGFKVPFVVRWPGKAKPGSVCTQMVSLADVLASVAEIVGEPLPPADKAAEDSVSFLPAILGDPAAPLRADMIVHSADGVFAIRKGPWKWIEGEPVDEIRPGARKARADEFRPQLYNTRDDPAETRDVSAAHPEVVNALRGLLNRYRDGNYSRALPPLAAARPQSVPALPLVTGEMLMCEALHTLPAKPWSATAGEWSAWDGGVWGAQKGPENRGADLSVPVALNDGTIDYEVNFNGANRHSLRVEWKSGEKAGSFRVEVARGYVALTKNPTRGEGADAVEPLARKTVNLEKRRWYPVRLTIKGDTATVQVGETIISGHHAVIGQPKRALNFLVFGSAAGFRNVKVVK